MDISAQGTNLPVFEGIRMAVSVSNGTQNKPRRNRTLGDIFFYLFRRPA